MLTPRAAKRPRNLVTQRAQEALTVGARVMWEYRICLARERAHGGWVGGRKPARNLDSLGNNVCVPEVPGWFRTTPRMEAEREVPMGTQEHLSRSVVRSSWWVGPPHVPQQAEV